MALLIQKTSFVRRVYDDDVLETTYKIISKNCRKLSNEVDIDSKKYICELCETPVYGPKELIEIPFRNQPRYTVDKYVIHKECQRYLRKCSHPGCCQIFSIKNQNPSCEMCGRLICVFHQMSTLTGRDKNMRFSMCYSCHENGYKNIKQILSRKGICRDIIDIVLSFFPKSDPSVFMFNWSSWD